MLSRDPQSEAFSELTNALQAAIGAADLRAAQAIAERDAVAQLQTALRRALEATRRLRDGRLLIPMEP